MKTAPAQADVGSLLLTRGSLWTAASGPPSLTQPPPRAPPVYHSPPRLVSRPLGPPYRSSSVVPLRRSMPPSSPQFPVSLRSVFASNRIPTAPRALVATPPAPHCQLWPCSHTSPVSPGGVPARLWPAHWMGQARSQIGLWPKCTVPSLNFFSI
jgi:hypothetical protein